MSDIRVNLFVGVHVPYTTKLAGVGEAQYIDPMSLPVELRAMCERRMVEFLDTGALPDDVSGVFTQAERVAFELTHMDHTMLATLIDGQWCDATNRVWFGQHIRFVDACLDMEAALQDAIKSVAASATAHGLVVDEVTVMRTRTQADDHG